MKRLFECLFLTAMLSPLPALADPVGHSAECVLIGSPQVAGQGAFHFTLNAAGPDGLPSATPAYDYIRSVEWDGSILNAVVALCESHISGLCPKLASYPFEYPINAELKVVLGGDGVLNLPDQVFACD